MIDVRSFTIQELEDRLDIENYKLRSCIKIKEICRILTLTSIGVILGFATTPIFGNSHYISSWIVVPLLCLIFSILFNVYFLNRENYQVYTVDYITYELDRRKYLSIMDKMDTISDDK